MGKQYEVLEKDDINFIKKQKLFYIASASKSDVNLSPKGYDCIRVMDEKTLLFLDYPGSGNRTATDVDNNGKVTIVFNAFEGKAKILRIFCRGKLIEKQEKKFDEFIKLFDEKISSIRRLILFDIYAVESSCGQSVPIMEYKKDRDELKVWVNKMVEKGEMQRYINEHHKPVDMGAV